MNIQEEFEKIDTRFDKISPEILLSDLVQCGLGTIHDCTESGWVMVGAKNTEQLLQPDKEAIMTIREVVTEILDNSPETVFSLWGLSDAVGLRKGERTMPHTVREACRDYADRSGAEFYCVDRKRSQYRYIPGFRIAGALEGRE